MTQQIPQRARRSEGDDTREAILVAARHEFSAGGYAKTTMRAIARSAGVDAALVHYYFGNKEKLFAAAVDLPAVPGEVLRHVLDGDPEQTGARILRTALTVWDTEAAGGGGRLTALLRSLADDHGPATMLREYLTNQVFAKVTAHLGSDQPQLRAALCFSQAVGLILTRFVVRAEPIASADREFLVECYAPTLQRYLTGPLPAVR
ncbi:TetR family transcriptional regulator [Longispora sp. K20-0274]|uniref:TetR/AcrR family transcriptional regulator n=1 Tax=Longispora sp. K20-0274 TaxID=3088255 RepID=UPI00399B92C4